MILSFLKNIKQPILICGFLVLFALIACSSGSSVRQIPTAPAAAVKTDIKKDAAVPPEQLISNAEYFFGRQKFSEALDIVNRVIADYAETINSDYAYYLRGRIYADILNFYMDREKAASAFRMVISSPPVSEFDELAQKELERIKK